MGTGRERWIVALGAIALLAWACVALLDQRRKAEEEAELNRLLLDAVRLGDAATVKDLIDLGADPATTDPHARSALHMAAFCGQRDVAQVLLAEGASPNAQSDRGERPLHCSGAMNCHTDVFQPGMFSQLTGPVLIKRKGRAQVAALLLAHGADVNAKTTSQWTPLHFAAFCGQSDVARQLLAQGADVNARDAQGNTPLHATAFGASQVVAPSSPAQQGIPSGCSGVMRCHVSEAQSAPAQQPAGAKTRGRRRRVVNVVASSPAGVVGMRLRCPSVAKDDDAYRRWSELVRKGRAEIAKLLLAHGADVNAQTVFAWTPLHYAASQAHADVAKVLLANGALVGAKDRQGRTPISLAEAAGHDSMIALLSRHLAKTGKAKTRCSRRGCRPNCKHCRQKNRSPRAAVAK